MWWWCLCRGGYRLICGGGVCVGEGVRGRLHGRYIEMKRNVVVDMRVLLSDKM